MARGRHKRSYELAIESLSHEGRGVGRVDGKTVFVDLALPGERVQAERFRKRSKFDEAIANEILEPSRERVTPPCAGYERCGGCSLQHLPPEAQIAHKEKVLFELIDRAAKLAPETVLMPLTGPTLGYRRKARLGVKFVPKKGGVLVGFRERRNPFIADIERCEVLHPSIGARLPALRALVASLSIPDAVPQFEVAVGDDDGGGVALVVRHIAPLTSEDEQKLLAFGDANGITMLGQAGGLDSVRRLDGNPDLDCLSYAVDDGAVTFRFQPGDFTQVNTDINRQMIARAMDLLALETDDHVVDLFCGLGNFSLPMARRVRRVTCVEGEAGLVARAKSNACANGIDNAWFEAADLSQPEFFARWRVDGARKLLVDPPRTGAAELFETADLSSFERIVYVSCNPATLARDIATATGRGFTLAAAGVMDMFPHTAHVESIALLEAR